MRRTFYVFFFSLISQLLYAQVETNIYKFKNDKDSLPLERAWNSLRKAIQTDDKFRLSKLFKFPYTFNFWFRDTSSGLDSNHGVEITEESFLKSNYSAFFNTQMKSCILKQTVFSRDVVAPSYDIDGNISAWIFLYRIVEPFKDSKGIQGAVFLKRVKSNYKITGITTIP